MNVEKVFANVTGRKMTPDEVTRYLKFQKEFEVPDTDPTWMIFVWFEFYQRIFEQFPEKARVESEEVARSLREASFKVTEASDAVVKASREKAVIAINELQETVKKNVSEALGPTLTKEIGKAVDNLSMKTTAKKWLIIGGSVACIVVTAGIIGAYVYGAQHGPIYGAFSEDYQLLITCNKPGWQKRVSTTTEGEKVLACYPYPATDGNLNGWGIKNLGGVSPSEKSP